MNLLSLLGLEGRIRRVKIAVGEGAIAAEDRVQLLRMAWDDEKQRLKAMLLLVIAVLGLTTVTVALLSVAVVVNFWETPHRVTAAWSVACVWVLLWVASLAGLWRVLRNASSAFALVREAFGLDWAWAQERFGLGHDDDESPRLRRPATQEELLARIAQQRQRIAVLQAPRPQSTGEAAIPRDEPMTAAALRVAREHPVASGVAAAAVVAVLGPRRLLRWAAFAAPIVWRMR